MIFTKVPSLAEPLSRQISQMKASLQQILQNDDEYLAFLLTGSCARGEATYRSDVDVLVVLKSGELKYSRTKALSERLEILDVGVPFVLPIQHTFILSHSLMTQEPGLASTLVTAQVLAENSDAVSETLLKLKHGAA